METIIFEKKKANENKIFISVFLLHLLFYLVSVITNNVFEIGWEVELMRIRFQTRLSNKGSVSDKGILLVLNK